MALFVPITGSLLGMSVLSSYAISIYQMQRFPSFYDTEGVWGILYANNISGSSMQPNYVAWIFFLIGA
jgi:hypothetical protein